MESAAVGTSVTGEGSVAADLARGIVWLVWHAVRLPVLAFLIIIEPIVRLVLWGAAFLGVLTSFLFEFSAAGPSFPFWLTISIAVGCMLLLGAYHVLLRLLS